MIVASTSHPCTSNKKIIELPAPGSAAPARPITMCHIIGNLHTCVGRLPGLPSQAIAKQAAEWGWLGRTHLRREPIRGCSAAGGTDPAGTGNSSYNCHTASSRNFCCQDPSAQWLPTTVSPSQSLRYLSIDIKVEWWLMIVCRNSDLFLHSVLFGQC